ncbi:hypothetical protein SLA2020_277740 [Shorea laevis]
MAFFEAMRGPSPSGPGSGLGDILEPTVKEASSQLLVHPMGAVGQIRSSPEADNGGKVVQSTPEALLSILGAGKVRFEKMLGELDRVITAVWVGLIQFGLGCGSFKRKSGRWALRRAQLFRKVKPKLGSLAKRFRLFEPRSSPL